MSALSNAAKLLGAKGGKARAKKLTAEEKHLIARKAILSRWSKKATK